MIRDSLTAPSLPVVQCVDLGRSDYLTALDLQRTLLAHRKAGEIPDTLLLTEHEPVITTGRNADFRHLLAPPETLAGAGIACVRCERGGDITYHGPGQLVAYPILDLGGFGRDLHRYIRSLEETAIRFCAVYGVEAVRRAGAPGVYTEAGKIASVGVFVSRWVTMHGLAINLAPDPAHLALMRPCGLLDTAFTSLALSGRPAPAYAEATRRYASIFAAVFACEIRDAAAAAAASHGASRSAVVAGVAAAELSIGGAGAGGQRFDQSFRRCRQWAQNEAGREKRA